VHYWLNLTKVEHKLALVSQNLQSKFCVYVGQMRSAPSKMQNKAWKNLLFWILFVSCPGAWCCIRVDTVQATNLDTQVSHENLTKSTKLQASTLIDYQPCQQLAKKTVQSFCQQPSKLPSLQIPLNPAQQTQISQAEEGLTDTEKQDDPPPLETQPNDLPQSSPVPMEQLLDTPEIDESDKIQRLRRALQERKQQSSESDINQELGLRVRPRPLEQLPLPPIEEPVTEFKPIGSLQARLGFFQTSNIFSSDEPPIEGGLVFTGLTLASAYFPLGSKTFLNGSIDGNLIRYIDQSKYNYNQIRFNLGVYQQFSRRMYGEISFSNQQLFYANNDDRPDGFKAGDRFLNENSLQLSLGRRDPLTSRLSLNSFYELSVNFADPQSRDRIINSFLVSLNYYLQQPLQVGLGYQFNYSDFTQREREDQFHRLFGTLNYRISDSSIMNVQSGLTFGGSTDPNIDFDGWFFSINYSLQLGQF
jgi:hypothetical protein